MCSDRRRDEIIQLRAVLATQAKGLKNIARINYGSTSDVNLDVINEDGELVMAFEAQKRITRYIIVILPPLKIISRLSNQVD